MRKYSVIIHRVKVNGGSLEEQVSKKYIHEIFSEVMEKHFFDLGWHNLDFMEYLSKELERVLIGFYSDIPVHCANFMSSLNKSEG